MSCRDAPKSRLQATLEPTSTLSVCRIDLQRIDRVGPAAYAKAFHAMYEVHQGESAQVIAQTLIKSVDDALELLRVADQIGFKLGAAAAFLRIQDVPWKPHEEELIVECIQSLHLPVPDSLTTRLIKARQFMHTNRKTLRESLLDSWKRSLLVWENALRTHPSDRQALTIVNACNSMFWAFGKAAILGVGDTLVQFLGDSTLMLRIMMESQNKNDMLSYEACLLVYLRVMRALSEGQVVCNHDLRHEMVDQCQSLAKYAAPSTALQQQFYPSTDSQVLQLSDYTCELCPDLDTYVRFYMSRKSCIRKNLASAMAHIASTLQTPDVAKTVLSLLGSMPDVPMFDLDGMVTTFIDTSTARIPHNI